MAKRFCTRLVLVLLCSSCAAVFGAEKPISISFGMDRAPYLFPRGSEQGLEIDIVTKALKLEGYKVQVVQLPHRLLKTALIDSSDLSGSAGVQTDATPGVFYSDIYINYENYVITRRKDGLTINTLEDLMGKKLAIWSDGYNQLGNNFYDLFNPKARVKHTPHFYEVNDQTNQINLFFNDDVEAIIVDKTVFNWYKNLIAPNSYIDNDFVYHDILPQVTGYNLVFKTRELRDSFNRGLHQMVSSGLYQQLVDYYIRSKGVTIQRQLSRDSQNNSDLILTAAEKRWLRLNPMVYFTGDPDWLPFEGFGEAGGYQGIVADYLKLIESKLGIYFNKIRPDSWSDALFMANAKQVDIISAGHANQSLHQHFKPVLPYINNPVVIVKTEEDDFVDGVGELANDTIAIMSTSSYANAFFTDFPDHQFVEVNSLAEGLEGVSAGKYDAMLASMALANYNIGDLGLYNLRIVGKTSEKVEVTLFVSKSKPILHGIINKALQSINTVQHQQILNRWIKQRYVEKTNYQLLIWIVVIAGVIVSIFLYWNRRLSEEILLRKEIEAALKIAKEKAELATQAKSSFLSNMSHEIRTPMNAILGFTDLLSEGVDNKQHLAFINTIQSAGNNLLSLINDILDLSKIEAGKLEIHPVATDPHDLFLDVAKLFMVELKKKSLDLVFDVDKGIPHGLMLDTVRLRQILFNLLGNAVKFTDSGVIRLEARQVIGTSNSHSTDLSIVIEDSGVGISSDDLSHIFGAFDQSPDQDTQKYGGTGLGLTISQRLAKLMNGEITVRSVLGEGARFELTLRDVEVSSYQINDSAVRQKNSADQLVMFKPSAVLIVDDIEINRLLVQECLAGSQLSFHCASSGPQALQLLKKHPIDLVLMDIGILGMDGHETALLAKAFTSVPILALTAMVHDPLEQAFIDSPFDGYLKKPIFKAALFKALQPFLPYEVKVIGEQKVAAPTAVILTELALQDAPLIFSLLNDTLLPQWQTIRVTNKMSEIKKFAQTIENLGTKYDIQACLEYAQELVDMVNACDIVGIKASLKNFPVLSGMIKKQLEKH
ncbi:MAG: two-component system sensor histidine kinase EvgS [Alteromonadaceae bacterium]